MSLSHTILGQDREPLIFRTDLLATHLEQRLPEAIFGLLMGSAAGGFVAPGSDLDLAFFLRTLPAELAFYERVEVAVADLLPATVRCDIGILNRAEPVYRFEALKGRLLFVRDRDTYATFFSRTCREYESQMASYERQRVYRLEAAHAL